MNTSEINHTMDEHAQHHPALKTFFNWVAAVLGVGSAADMVPLVVGVLSAGWLLIQGYGYFTVDLPNKKLDRENKRLDKEIKKAQLAALVRGIAEFDACNVEGKKA